MLRQFDQTTRSTHNAVKSDPDGCFPEGNGQGI